MVTANYRSVPVRILRYQFFLDNPSRESLDVFGPIVAKAIKSRLWRMTCSERGESCASVAKKLRTRPECKQPESCIAHSLIGLDANRSQYLPPRFGVRMLEVDGPEEAYLLTVTIRGVVPDAAVELVHKSLLGLNVDGIILGGHRALASLQFQGWNEGSLGGIGAQLAWAREDGDLRFRFVTPWVIDKTSRRSTQEEGMSNEQLAARFRNELLRAVYRAEALALEDRCADGKHVSHLVDSGARQGHCLRVKSDAHDTIERMTIAVSAPELRESDAQYVEFTTSKGAALCLHRFRPTIRLSPVSADQSQVIAPAYVFGVGQITAEGYGVFELSR